MLGPKETRPWWDVYQAKTWNVFLSPEYGARVKDPYMAEVLRPMGPDYASTVYSYVDLPHLFHDTHEPVDADWISWLRFSFDANPDLLTKLEWPHLNAVGARRLRLIRRGKNHPILP